VLLLPLLLLSAETPRAVLKLPMLWRNRLPPAASAILPVTGEKIPVLLLEVNLIEGALTLPLATVFGPAGPGGP
jgi:hypothetical protein